MRRALHRPNGVRLARPLPLTTSFCPKCARNPASKPPLRPRPSGSSRFWAHTASFRPPHPSFPLLLRSPRGLASRTPLSAGSLCSADREARWSVRCLAGLDPTVPAVSPVPSRRAHLPSLSLPGVSPPGFSAPEEAQVQRRPAPTPAPERGSSARLSHSAPSRAAAAAGAAACHAERATLPALCHRRTPFNFFSDAVRPTIKEQHPHADQKGISKVRRPALA